MLLVTVVLALAFGTVPATANDPATNGPTVERPRLDRFGVEREPVINAPTGFVDTLLFQGLTQPTSIAFAPDGRVFVAEKAGLIKVFDGVDDSTAAVWADLRTRVNSYWDRGLLGLAVDPSFASNGRVYVAYAHDAAIGGDAPRWNDVCPNPPGGNTNGCVISGRVSALVSTGPGTVSEQVLIEDWCQQFPSHSMGALEFGPDGALYVSGGEGASFNNTDGGDWGQFGSPDTNPCGDPPGGVGGSQTAPTAEGGALRAQDVRTLTDPTGLSGTVIRIDRSTGAALATNPGGGAVSSNQKRIISYGLRNPFRIAIHPDTGELWVGDVGWNSWEEINRHGSPTAAVRNFGWPCREGSGSSAPGSYGSFSLCQTITGQSTPFLTYSHATETVAGDGCPTGGGSLSGLAFYPGGPYPGEYDGALFVADYTRSCIWVIFDTDGNGVPEPATMELFQDVFSPVDLAVAPNGDIVYVNIGNAGQTNGSVRRIQYTAANQPPFADLDADPTSGGIPLSVDFDARGSFDPDGDPLTYAWDLDGDGAFDDGSGSTAQRTYSTAGTITVSVRVRDDAGLQDVASVVISAANDGPTATITSPATSTRWEVGEAVAYAGTATDPDEGTLPAAAFSWTLVMHHCATSCHEHVVTSWNGTKSGTFTGVDHDYPSWLELRLTVEDATGATASDSVVVQPDTVDLTVRTSPTGLQATAGSQTGPTPRSIVVIKGGSALIGVAPIQGLGSAAYRFDSWSDGGAATHALTATADATYTATFDLLFADAGASPFLSDIAWLVDQRITGGCGSAPPRFCPGQAVTRAQMASFLVRALDLPASSVDRFVDDEQSIHEADINALARAGITTGCAVNRYCPTQAVTRAEMASFLVRAFDIAPSDADPFTDDERSVHERDINALAAADITGGCTATTYCPTQLVTRGQMAAFLHRAFED